MKGKPSELSINELNIRLEQMAEFRKWMIYCLPNSFPEGEKTDFSLVFEKAMELIIAHINLKYLLEE